MIRKVTAKSGAQQTLTLEMPADLVAAGGPVLDASGGLYGIAVVGSADEAIVISQAGISRMLDPLPGNTNEPRGWLGAALQPISVPEALRGTVGQASGRMVVSLRPSGPAERAGVRPGDILLSMDGHALSGAHALRALLGPERVGRQVEVRLLRGGLVETRHLVIVPRPAD